MKVSGPNIISFSPKKVILGPQNDSIKFKYYSFFWYIQIKYTHINVYIITIMTSKALASL